MAHPSRVSGWCCSRRWRLHADRTAGCVARHAIKVDDQRRANVPGVVLLLNLRCKIENAVTHLLVRFEVRSTLEGEARPRRRVTVHESYVGILPQRIGHPTGGMPYPDAQLGVTVDLDTAAQRQIRRAPFIGVR